MFLSVSSVSAVDDDSSIIGIDADADSVSAEYSLQENLQNDFENTILGENEPSNEWYVDGSRSEDGNGSIDNPFNNLKSSIDQSKDGDTIFIAPGVYRGSGLNVNLSIDKSLSLFASDSDVVFDGENKYQIFNIDADSFDIYGITFTNGNSSGRGGAIFSQESLELVNCVFVNNHADDLGGAVFVLNNFTDTEIWSTFINNSAYNGGAIAFGGKYFRNNVINSYFENNTAERGGGAVYILGEASNNTFKSVFYRNNAEKASGGGIFFYGPAEGNVFNSRFKDNHAAYGAGMFFLNVADNNRFDSDFSFNVAESCGGAMFFYAKSNNNNFTGYYNDNEALGKLDPVNGNGGAITFKQVATNAIFIADFVNNLAVKTGGGVNFRQTPINITFNSNFINNSAMWGGGVNFFETFENVVFNGSFINNSAVYGGGIFVKTGQIENTSFTGNHATYGGAIFFNGTGCVNNVDFTANSAEEGGAIFTNGNLTVANAAFEDNSAEDGTNQISLNMTVGTVTLANVTPKSVGPYKIADLSITDITVDDTVKITTEVTWKGNAVNEGNVSIIIDNKEYAANIENGTGVIEIPYLDEGSYANNVTFSYDQYYNDPSQMAVFNVTKEDTKLITPSRVISVTEGVNGYKYQFILKDMNGTALAGYAVSVSFNGKNQTVITDDAGWGTVTLNANAEGTYDVVITFVGDAKYNGITQSGTLKLVKEKTAFVAPDRVVYVQQMSRGYSYSAILKDVNGNALANRKVLFIFGNQKQVTYTDANGWATVKLTAVNAGTQSVTIKFAGDRYYRETTATRTIKIVQEASKLTVSDYTFKSTDNPKQITAKLESKSDVPVNGAKVTFKVNGMTYVATTNESGIAVFSINLDVVSIYTAVTSFETSRFFKATSTTSKVVIN